MYSFAYKLCYQTLKNNKNVYLGNKPMFSRKDYSKKCMINRFFLCHTQSKFFVAIYLDFYFYYLLKGIQI